MYAFQTTYHGKDRNGNSRYAVTLMQARTQDDGRIGFVSKVRLVGGFELRNAANRLHYLGHASAWAELPELPGIKTRAAQLTSVDGEPVVEWHHVADSFDRPPHNLIALAQLAHDRSN